MQIQATLTPASFIPRTGCPCITQRATSAAEATRTPTAITRTPVTPELGSGPTPVEFMDGLLNKAKDKVDDCALLTSGWTTLYARFDSGEIYLKDRVASPSSLQECQNIPRRNNLTSTPTKKWCPSTTLFDDLAFGVDYVSQLMKMVSVSALHHLAI
jgi:hypothetical protein